MRTDCRISDVLQFSGFIQYQVRPACCTFFFSEGVKCINALLHHMSSKCEVNNLSARTDRGDTVTVVASLV